jgi:tetratricopeptide (TPR) repeat protein
MPCAAIAVNRPSISARLSHAAVGAPAPATRRGLRVCALAAGLLATAVAAAAAQPAALTPPGPVLRVAQASTATQPAGSVAPPGQIGVAEPIRPTLSVPYDTAIAEYRAGRTGEALALAERALQSDPRNPQLRFLRGVVLTEQRRLDLAIEAFGSLIADYPELPEPYNNLAVIHADRSDWDAARQALEQSIRAVPTYALAHENLGDIHIQLAARSYEQAGRLDPRNESARGKLALARELIGRIQSPEPDRNPRPSAQPQVNPR